MPKLFFHLNFGVVRGRCLKIVQSEYLTWANNYYLESLYRCHMFNLHFFVAEKYVTFQCDAIKESEMINLIKKNKTKYWYEQKDCTIFVRFFACLQRLVYQSGLCHTRQIYYCLGLFQLFSFLAGIDTYYANCNRYW